MAEVDSVAPVVRAIPSRLIYRPSVLQRATRSSLSSMPRPDSRRQFHEAVDDRRLGRYQLTPQWTVEDLRRDIFEDRRGGAGRLEMPSDG